ncbi:unnamed protein product, partial [Hapterophycus canaliculatus]
FELYGGGGERAKQTKNKYARKCMSFTIVTIRPMHARPAVLRKLAHILARPDPSQAQPDPGSGDVRLDFLSVWLVELNGRWRTVSCCRRAVVAGTVSVRTAE